MKKPRFSGSGIPRICVATKEAGYSIPIIKDSCNLDITELTIFIKKDKIQFSASSTTTSNSNLTEQEQSIVDYIKQYGSIRRIVVEDILEVKNTRAKEILNSLLSKQIIKVIGSGPSIKYVLK